MKLYQHLTKASFQRRLNRFSAEVLLNGQIKTVHVKNTGRLGELLLPEAAVWLEAADNPERKTQFDLVAVEHRGYTVNIDSQAPNRIFREWAEQGRWAEDAIEWKREVTFGDSRFDFRYTREGHPGFVEVKGVTLFDEAGMAYFPDAPTERGVKHLRGLIQARLNGCEAGVCFILQRDDVIGLRPNDVTHSAFGDALREAHACGVRVCALACHTVADACTAIREVPVDLSIRTQEHG